MRKSKTEADMLDAAGDAEGAGAVRQKANQYNKELKGFCQQNGLKYRTDRVRTYGAIEPKKVLDKSAGSGIINVNRAKVIDIFNDNDLDVGDPTPEDIENELLKSSIGREVAELLPELPENIILTHGYDPNVRAEEKDGRIYIYVNNCKNIQWVARTIIHEYTHYRYGIGNSQWAECVCIAQELKHARNREYLTIAEKRTIINAVKSDPDYKKLNWRKGGFINGRRKSN